jgi:hypothetical protein
MTTTRRDLLKFATAVGIAGVLPATTATAAPHTGPIEETFTGMCFDLSATPTQDLGFPVYKIWESSAGITVERTSGEMVIGVGHGPDLRAAIMNAIDVTRAHAEGDVRVLQER